MSFSAFAGGLLNPLTIPAHVLTLVGVGLLIGTQASGRLIAVLCFVAGLAGGLAAIARAIGLTPALDVLLILSTVSGALVALAIAVPPILSATVALIAGLALGLDSPPQVVSLADATASLVGTGLSAVLAFALVVLIAAHLTRIWQRIGLRILGSWIAASATLVLALRFARGVLFVM
jgi:urease accessory protein